MDQQCPGEAGCLVPTTPRVRKISACLRLTGKQFEILHVWAKLLAFWEGPELCDLPAAFTSFLFPSHVTPLDARCAVSSLTLRLQGCPALPPPLTIHPGRTPGFGLCFRFIHLCQPKLLQNVCCHFYTGSGLGAYLFSYQRL